MPADDRLDLTGRLKG